MEVRLPPELESLVAAKVDSGRYASPSEGVREALELMAERERDGVNRQARLRAEIAAGLDEAARGDVLEFNERLADDVKSRGRQRLAKRDA